MFQLPSFIKKIKIGDIHDNFRLLAHFITGYTIMIVLAFDFGILYSNTEREIYQHPIFLMIAGYCVAFELLDDYILPLVIISIWFIIKYVITKSNQIFNTNRYRVLQILSR